MSVKPGLPLSWRDQRRPTRWPILLAVCALHLLVLAAVLRLGTTQQRIVEAPPLFVHFIAAPPAPPVVETPPPPPPPPRPVKPRPKPRLLTTSNPVAPSPPVEVAPKPVPVETPPPPAPPAPPPPPAPPAPIAPPNFVAAYLDNPAPEYPRVSLRLRESGQVLLRVLVSPQGRSVRAELAKSSGYPRLDQAALEVVQRWRFVPARQGDQPVAAWVLVPFNFHLED